MCGIVGIINVDKSNRALSNDVKKDVQRAMEVQQHRGPDDQGVCGFSYTYGDSYSATKGLDLNDDQPINGLIGFNRLSIKDLSIAGHQPMTAIGGKVILAFNGEIYNDTELRNELVSKGYKFRSTSDTEVILNLYLEYGFEKMIGRLNGMFAIVITDLRKEVTFLARDRYGIKPLYYTFFKDYVAFASEIKSIIQFQEFDRQIDYRSLDARLIFSRPSSKILLRGVEMLNPGQAFSISSKGDSKFWYFYDINDHIRSKGKYSNINSVLEETEEILSDVSKRQMLSDVKVGCQLSGGVDSTLVSYFANKMDGNNLNDGISIIDDAGANGEEFYMDHVGKSLGLDVHKYKIEPDYYVENYQKTIWFNDAPVYSPYFANHLRLAEKAKNHVTVTLSGEGADELAGGYNRFANGIYHKFISKLNIKSNNIKSYKTYAEYAVMSDATNKSFISASGNDPDDLIREQIDIFNSFTGSNFTKQIKFEMTQRLPEGLMRQDKMNMAHSVENRVPLLDNVFVDFVMQLPEDMLLQFQNKSPLLLSQNPFEWAAGKYFLKELCAKKFGYEFAYRKKTIMVLDKRQMLAFSGFRTLFYDQILPGMQRRGLIDSSLVKSWFDSVNSISERDYNSLWRSMSLETWFQMFIDNNNIS